MNTNEARELERKHQSLSRLASSGNIHAVITGIHSIGNLAHAEVAEATILAYGDDPLAAIYFEATIRNNADHPADILVIHPDIGVLVIEVKAWSTTSGYIRNVNSSNFYIKGSTQPQNPFEQARKMKSAIERAVEHECAQQINPITPPICSFMVAFPNISREQWVTFTNNHNPIDSTKTLFADQLENVGSLKHHISRNIAKIKEAANRPDGATRQQILLTRAAFGSTAVLSSEEPELRDIPQNSLGAILDGQRYAYKRLSNEQQELSNLPLRGFPRLIRGVAGSGKSIVLANMVARYLHTSDNPEELKVAVVCYNRSLAPMLEAKVSDAYLELAGKDLPAGVKVISMNRLMYHLAKYTNAPINYLRTQGTSSEERASNYLEQWKTNNCEPICDAVFVDEAQDLLADEIEFLWRMTKPSQENRHWGGNLVLFYDDAQNIYGRPRPTWSDLGIDVQRGDRSKVMRQCFRNTKQIVELGFNILLGKQADSASGTRQFADIAYLKNNDLVTETDRKLEVAFTQRSFRLPEVRVFPDAQAEITWLVDKLYTLIVEEHIRPQDILLLSHLKDYAGYKPLLRAIRDKIPATHLESIHLPHLKDNKDKPVFKPRCLTSSTPNTLKGYDADVVFIYGADQFNLDTSDKKYPPARERAIFYVAATRAKSLLFVSGLQKEGGSLLSESVDYLKSEQTI